VYSTRTIVSDRTSSVHCSQLVVEPTQLTLRRSDRRRSGDSCGCGLAVILTARASTTGLAPRIFPQCSEILADCVRTGGLSAVEAASCFPRSEPCFADFGGRVGLYAGFCPRAPRGDPDGRSSISACRCRQAHAVYPQARAGRPRTPAQVVLPKLHDPFDLAPGGVYRAVPVTRDAGGLLHHRFTLTDQPKLIGGLFSVALSRGSPRVAVSNHPALWSPDVPRPRCRDRDRPADSSVVNPS